VSQQLLLNLIAQFDQRLRDELIDHVPIGRRRVSLGFGAQLLRALTNLPSLRAQARIVHHFFNIAQAIRPVAEVIARDGTDSVAAGTTAAGIVRLRAIGATVVGSVDLATALALKIVRDLFVRLLLPLLILLLISTTQTAAGAATGAIALLSLGIGLLLLLSVATLLTLLTGLLIRLSVLLA